MAVFESWRSGSVPGRGGASKALSRGLALGVVTGMAMGVLMRASLRGPVRALKRTLLCAVALSAAVAMHPALAEDPPYRFSAAITVQQTAPFVRLPLPASAYGRTEQADLRDLRVVDAAAERVPFALLQPRADTNQTSEQARETKLYPLPARPAAGKPWPAPVEVTVQGDRISVRQSGSGSVKPVKHSPGWLFDQGDPRERKSADSPAQLLRLRWSGPAEFSAGFDIETSDDLRRWRAAGAGQVLALASANGPLTQANVPLPANAGRFVRLVWNEPGAAPLLTGAAGIAVQQRAVSLDAPTELSIAASTEPPRKGADETSLALAKRALHFDLGGALPLVQLDLQLGQDAGGATRIAPVRLQQRSRVDEPWRELAGHVFYRIERAGALSTSAPLALRSTLRYVRVVPDERAAPLDATQTRLLVQAQLASVVFAAQGRAPYALLAGAAKAPAGALPVGTLVPALDDERPRFGQATLGEWNESEAVLRQAESQQRVAAMRPWLLWAVLLLGVAGLGFMVWRLARGGAEG